MNRYAMASHSKENYSNGIEQNCHATEKQGKERTRVAMALSGKVAYRKGMAGRGNATWGVGIA